MGMFIAAYLVIWLAVVFYVTLLGVRQQRLARQIETLWAEAAQREDPETRVSRAA